MEYVIGTEINKEGMSTIGYLQSETRFDNRKDLLENINEIIEEKKEEHGIGDDSLLLRITEFNNKNGYKFENAVFEIESKEGIVYIEEIGTTEKLPVDEYMKEHVKKWKTYFTSM